MTVFDKQKYVDGGSWRGNDLLVQPDTAIKACGSCGELYYSREFADAGEFRDGKLPVCTRCYRGDNKIKAMSMLDLTGVMRICRKCGEETSISQFAYRGGKHHNDVQRVCRDCNGSYCWK